MAEDNTTEFTPETPTISAKLKQMREEQGLSVEAVAEKLNLSAEQIYNLEGLSQSLSEMSPFERGYVRNYAALLELSLDEFESEFPEGVKVGSELHSVQRYSYRLSKPIMARGWVKGLVYIVIFIAIIVALSMLNINFDDFKIDEATMTSQETSISLPDIPAADGPQDTMPQQPVGIEQNQ